MPSFKVKVLETSIRTLEVEIEAEDRDDAYDTVEERMINGDYDEAFKDIPYLPDNTSWHVLV